MDFIRYNRLALHFLLGIALTVVYPMQELFSGNQNIYFLWGMAELLPNAFAADPLLNSPDPYPLFSWLISIFPIQFLGIWTTLIHVLLSAVYSFALFGIVNQLTSICESRGRFYSFLALFVFLHSSPIWGGYLKLTANIDLRWMWDSGIAEQGVLRGYLQPSVFGVFLLLSVYFGSKRNFTAAILSLAPACMMHANYLFLGGILTILFIVLSRMEKKTVLAAALLLLAVLPYSIYLFGNFILLDESLKSAIDQAVMSGYSENIHLNPSNWLGAKLFMQAAILILGLFAIWKTKLSNTFLCLLASSIGLSAFAYLSDNTTLISLNPWRFSIVLIPISSALIIARIVSGSFWEMARPAVFGLIASVSLAFVYYRIFGNSSHEFMQQWWMIQMVILAILIPTTIFLSRQNHLSKTIEPMVVVSLIVVGLVDSFVEKISRSNSEQFKVISQLGSEEDPKTVYIIPADWTSFRLNARKAVFADQNLVYGPALPTLISRLEELKNVSKTGNYLFLAPSTTNGTTVKLIAPKHQKVENALSSKELSDNYSLYLLRQ